METRLIPLTDGFDKAVQNVVEGRAADPKFEIGLGILAERAKIKHKKEKRNAHRRG